MKMKMKNTAQRVQEKKIDRFIEIYPWHVTGAINKKFQLMDSSFDVKKEWYRKSIFRLKLIGIITVMLIFAPWKYFLPEKAKPVIPTKITINAGTIKEIKLHSTTFSTKTTLVTSKGVYQLVGAVSAAIGDATQLIKWQREDEESPVEYRYKPKMCVQSKIKTDCYPLM